MGVLLKPDSTIKLLNIGYTASIYCDNGRFKLKMSLPADELWTSLTDQLKIGKDKFV